MKGLKKFGYVISAFFLLIFIQFAIMQLRQELSLIMLLEIGSVALIILLYYFIVRIEVRVASKIIEERLMRVEERFENVEKRFEEDIRELKELLKKKRLARK